MTIVASPAPARRSRKTLSSAIRVVTALAILVWFPSLAWADTVRVIVTAGVHARPDEASDVLTRFQPGALLNVNPRQGEWFPILLTHDERGIRRLGYIAAALVELVARSSSPPAPTVGLRRRASSAAVLVDAAIAEHVTEDVSRIDVPRNRDVGERVTRQAAHRLTGRGYRVNEAAMTSVGLYFEGSSVLRVMRNAEPAFAGARVHYDDSKWDLSPSHRVVVHRDAGQGATTSRDEPAHAPFWLGPWLEGRVERSQLVRELYRSLDSGVRLARLKVKAPQQSSQTVPEATALAQDLHADLALVVLIRGRDRPNPPRVSSFFRDALKDNRYEVSGAVVSAFVLDTTTGELLLWESKWEGKTTAPTLARVVDGLVNRCANRLQQQ